MVDENDEKKWREGLEARGPDWVRTKLAERAGQPGDEVFDVVFSGSNPTRAFCSKWCAEQDNRFIRMSGTTKLVWVAAIVLLVFVVKAFVAFQNERPAGVAGSRPQGAPQSTYRGR